jgi:hypothetical protein
MRRLVTVLSLLALGAVAAPAQAAEPKAFGAIECKPTNGVRFCQGSTATRVASFDGQPLDVNVTLPARDDRDLPLVVLSHGYGGSKYGLVNGEDPGGFSTSSLPWAQRGYAVLTLSSRGFGNSCGAPASRTTPACADGWIRLDDTRFEIRDVQHLAGLLADQGIVDPRRVGVHGGSYGGGVSMALGLLRDRIMDTDGSLKPWTSPKGRPMRIAAVAPYIPWSDLVYSLLPNGRYLDYLVPKERESFEPFGFMKESFVSGLYASGEASGFYAPPGGDPDADLRRWYPRVNAGDPYDGEPMAQDIAEKIYRFKSNIAIPRDRQPAPLFVANGWTDDLFPVDEALRLYNAINAEHPQTPFAMMHLDFGHQRGSNKADDVVRYQRHVVAWMERYVKGDADAPTLAGVETLTQTCPKDAPSGGPFSAPSWAELHPGEVRLDDAAGGTVTSAGGDPGIARAIDPIGGGGDACARTAAADEQGTLNFRFPAAAGDGYTLMGAPTIVADLTVTGPVAQVTGRLWDVAPDGQQTLVARTIFRPDATGRQAFQLHPNGYRFAPGHVAKLQLLGRDAPYARPANRPFSVAVKDVEVRLPVAERPGGQVLAPAPPFVPAGRAVAPVVSRRAPGRPQVPPMPRGSSDQPPVVARRARLYLVAGCRGVRLRGPDVKKVKRVTVSRAGMRRRTDRRIPFRVALRGRGRAIRALAVKRNGRSVRLRATLPSRCA